MRARSLARNPVLIGGVTALVVIVAVFLSYNANRGLPMVPTYDLKVELPSAANLVPGNEVRIGATRVGQIASIVPKTLSDGRTIAVAAVKIEDRLRPLPVDTSQLVRFKSALGLKYLELTRGKSARGLAAGATIPLDQAGRLVEFDEAFSWADEKTRAEIERQVSGFGDAIAGRGDALNTAIAELPALLDRLRPVMANLAAPESGLGDFFSGLAAVSGEIAPVADQNARLFVGLDATFGALASVATELKAAIAGGPDFEQALADELPQHSRFFANATTLMKTLQPGMSSLAGAAEDLADAAETGGPALRRSVAVSRRLRPTLTGLKDLAEDPMARLGVRDLGAFSAAASPLLAFVTPAQTVCNYGSLLLRNASSNLSVGDSVGTSQRFQLLLPPSGPNSETGYASAPAAGGGEVSALNYLHTNPYPNTAAPGQTRECEAGNEPYRSGQQMIGNVPGNQSTDTERTSSSLLLDGSRRKR